MLLSAKTFCLMTKQWRWATTIHHLDQLNWLRALTLGVSDTNMGHLWFYRVDMAGHVLVERPLCGQDLTSPEQVVGNDTHLARYKSGMD